MYHTVGQRYGGYDTEQFASIRGLLGETPVIVKCPVLVLPFFYFDFAGCSPRIALCILETMFGSTVEFCV